MTDHTPLTDEELALWKREARFGLGTRDTERIIAEVERLRTHACSRTCQGQGDHDVGFK